MKSYNFKWNDPVYIGRESKNGNGIAICKVLDSDIATGAAAVFNRETKKVEVITLNEKRTLDLNIRRLAIDTQELDCGY